MTTGQAYALELRASYDELWQTLQRFSVDAREQAELHDGWTPKALLAHIAFWDDFQTRRMQAAYRGDTAQTGVTWPALDNDQRIAIDRERDWGEIVVEAEAARQRMIDFARSLRDEAFTIDYPEGERTLSLAKLLSHMVRHTQLHRAELTAYLDQAGAEE